MNLIKTLEDIHPLDDIRQGLELLLRGITQEVGNLRHGATDAETGGRIEKLTAELDSIRGSAAHAVMANTDVHFITSPDLDEVRADDDREMDFGDDDSEEYEVLEDGQEPTEDQDEAVDPKLAAAIMNNAEPAQILTGGAVQGGVSEPVGADAGHGDQLVQLAADPAQPTQESGQDTVSTPAAISNAPAQPAPLPGTSDIA